MKSGIQSFVFLTWLFFLPTAFALEPNSDENREWWAGEESYTIHLKGEMMLSDILDTGIRPRHVPALGHHSLQFQAKSLSLIFSSGEIIQTKNGYGRIYVGEDQQILNITYYEDYNTGIDEALERLLGARPVFDGGGRSVEDLIDRINEVRKAEDHWVDRPFGIGKKNIDDYWGGSVVAGRSHDVKRPFRFITTVIRNYNDRERDRPDRNPMGVLLAPPEGYEHISFEYVTTPTDPNATPMPYLSPLEQAQKLSENIQNRDKATKVEDLAPQPTHVTRGDTPKSNPEDQTKGEVIFLIVLAALGILGVVISIYFYTRKYNRK